MPLIRKFVVAIGIGLTMAALRFDILKQLQNVGANYWTEWTTRTLLVTLIVVCIGLLVATVLLEDDCYLPYVSGLGAILLGFFLFVPVAVGWGHLGDLVLGPKLAIAGSALIALGALPTQALFSWKRSRGRASLPLYLTWLAAAVGSGLVIVSLGRHIASTLISGPNSVGLTGKLPRYWTSAAFTGNHSLGILMLSLAVLVIVLAVGDAVFRAPVLGKWALAASLPLLGLTLYYPFTISKISALSIGGGLALEGAALASVASLAAVAVEHGVVDSKALNVPRLVAVAGIGLVISATWTELWKALPGTIWGEDTTFAGFPVLLAAIALALVVLSLAFAEKWLLPAVGIIGWIIFGYFGYELASVTPKTDLLGPAIWLGVAGGALMGLSALSLYKRSAWRRRLASVTSSRVPLLVTAAGTGLVLISLWLDTEKAQQTKAGTVVHFSYWDWIDDHSLGIVMLVLAALTLAALLAVLLLRFSALYTVVLAASLALLGISLFLPASEAFNHLGALRAGAWLALVGSLAASAGAVALWLPDHLLAQTEVEGVDETAPKRARTTPKGKKRVPEMRRGK
jgi:hypothetical protein